MKFMSAYIFFTVLICVFNEGTSSDIDDKVNAITLSQNDTEEQSNEYSACGGVYIKKRFVLESPNYPEDYASNIECHYLLKGPHCVTYYKFEFLDFDLESSDGCTKDKLEIEDQDVLCGKEYENKMYFSKNGSLHIHFKTDENIAGKGYKILVTRMACKRKDSRNAEEETTTEYFETTTTDYITEEITQPIIQSRNFPNFIQSNNECCANNFNEKRFILTSPNFPYTLNKKTDCTYQIHKANNNICRLRLNFLVFWIGYSNYNNYCPYGFLEIDGKYICGCNKELKLTTTFGDSDVKILKFKTDGFLQNYKTGFILEVIQDECPTKYSPENINKLSNNRSKEFKFYNDQINRVAWPSDTQQDLIQKLQLINERTEILDDDDIYVQSRRPKIVKSVYFFAAPEYNEIPPLLVDREKTTYIETSNLDSIVTNTIYNECLNWNQINFNELVSRYGQTLQQTCKKTEDNEANTKSDMSCTELNYISGYFRTTGYPCYYPENQHQCYRLRRQPGYCAIRIYMNDFQIENSYNCQKDYVLLTNGYKYCGDKLFRASWTMDLRNRDYEDIRFVTDGYYSGRGFSGVYQQIACEDTTYPTHPSVPFTTSTIPTTSSPVYCDRLIRDKSFTITVNEDHEICTFRIHQSSKMSKYTILKESRQFVIDLLEYFKREEENNGPLLSIHQRVADSLKNVCKVNFYFEKFDLFCAVESLVIDGMMFCGHLTGRVVTMNLSKEPKNIIYRSTLENKYDNLRFKIQGEQITDDCLIPEVPAERLIRQKSIINPQINVNENRTEEFLENNSKSNSNMSAQIKKQFKDICGIVTETPEKELPSTFCDILLNKYNAMKCVALEENSITVSDMPQENKKFEVKIMNAEKIEEIKLVDFHEIDCDQLKE